MQLAVQTAARFIRQSNTLIIGTGAGMGKDSGLPDFRGNEGFWNNYPPYRGKFNFVECANPNFLRQHPHLFWGFYGSRLAMYRDKQPHRGYQMLSEIAGLMAGDRRGKNFFAVTSNVDGHFQRAGYPEQKILQVHGSINYLQCYVCQKIQVNDFKPDVDYQAMSCSNLPRCRGCAEILRPNILMFNDYEWMEDRAQAQRQNYDRFFKENISERVVAVEIGCGMAVPTMRSMMEQIYYKSETAKLIRVNLDGMTSSAGYFDRSRYVDVPFSALEGVAKVRQLL